MVMLRTVSEDEFLDNLTKRYSQKQIYTFLGEQVVSMNPFTRMDNTSPEWIAKYNNRYMYEVQPHVFALAEDTFRQLRQSKKDQCVIITGESGAGKTEASKIFMTYIAEVSGKHGGAEGVKDHLLQSNPVLEAFGNAKTVRNDNSSRFGKYMEIQFDGAAAPLGGRISQYLLEKSRVVTRALDERSFHIFYLVMSQSAICNSLGLTTPEDYNYLNLSKCYKVPAFNDDAEFKEVDNAMSSLGFKAEDKESVWKFIGAILQLGNVTFEECKENRSVNACVISNQDELAKVAKLLQVEPAVLGKALTTRSITTGMSAGKSDIDVHLNPKQGAFARDSLGKALYSKIFDWVVNTVNHSIETHEKSEMSTGVLDIYGFEIFDRNSFEQFCINFCNEKLQQLFIELVLQTEQRVYIEEGIEWTKIDYFDNQPILTLIEAKGGIFKTLNDACMVGEASPDDFLRRLDENFAQHPHYSSFVSAKDKTIKRDAFRIKHYAGEVDYEITEFIFKNQDTLFQSISDALQTSNNPLMAALFPPVERSRKRPVTAGTHFVTSVGQLVTKLKCCAPHYIRCIKSNDQKRAFVIDAERVKHQCRYLNLVETVRVRKAGFAARRHYNLFLQRYKMISPKTWPIWRGSARDGVKEIFQAMNIEENEYRMGKTQVFVKDAMTLYQIELKREELLPVVAVKLQALFRGWKARKRVKGIRAMLNKKEYAVRIERAYVKCKLRKYWNVMLSNYKAGEGVNKGRIMKWPKCPFKWYTRVQPALEKIHMCYWAHRMIEPLNEGERAAIRHKVLAYTMFSGKKPWNCARAYQADYCNVSKNPNKEAYKNVVELLVSTGGDQEILFSDTVLKVNRKAKPQVRVFVLTDRYMYKYSMKMQQRKEAISLSAVEGIVMSPFDDSYVIIKMAPPNRDLVLDLRVNGVEMASEFATILHMRLKEMGKEHTIEFVEKCQFNNSRKEGKEGKNNTLTWKSSHAPAAAGLPGKMRARLSVLQIDFKHATELGNAFLKNKDGTYSIVQ